MIKRTLGWEVAVTECDQDWQQSMMTPRGCAQKLAGLDADAPSCLSKPYRPGPSRRDRVGAGARSVGGSGVEVRHEQPPARRCQPRRGLAMRACGKRRVCAPAEARGPR